MNEPTQASREAASFGWKLVEQVRAFEDATDRTKPRQVIWFALGPFEAAALIDSALAAERERCAKVADAHTAIHPLGGAIAAAIRSLPAEGDPPCPTG